MSSTDSLRVEKILRDYLERYLGLDKLGDAWTIGESPVSGRGVRATRDIQPGDLIFWDHPIVLGPRRLGPPVCVGCHVGGDEFIPCPKGCGLPVCDSECAKSSTHQKECTILSAYGDCQKNNEWSIDLLHSLSALRCLEINELDREVIYCLQANKDGSHNWEVDVLKAKMENNLDSSDEEWMNLCILVMNTNAFETLKRKRLDSKENEGSLRGLYPLSSFMNHDCAPNTRHVFDENCNMIVQATKFIRGGEELTTNYCPLLWDTSSRRLHLAKSKQFACCCKRCRDPSEFGTYLSALPCPESPCNGVIISTNPLIPHRSSWKCTECFSNIPLDQVMRLQKVQGLLLMGTDSSDPESVLSFLELKKVRHNSVVEVQLKVGLCLQLGHVAGYRWEELSDYQIEMKESICKEVLDLLEKLQTGECRLRAIIMFELQSALCERLRRAQLSNNNEGEADINCIKSIKEEIINTFKVASDILINDASAPPNFVKKINGNDLFKNY